ncbi:MAG: hypothetical protein K5756_02570 [Clostridiales bacterium]|nr:hypothetical protein [Clostridiales bacterium]
MTKVKNQKFDLDTSAKMYSYIKNRKWNQMFRVSATLYDKVDPELLIRAVAELKDRFPTFFVTIRGSFFWRHLRAVDCTDIVEEDDGKWPCRPIEIGRKINTPMFRVLYKDSTIALEIFHAVTDGTGAMRFLQTIVATYFRLQGIDVPSTDSILDAKDKPTDEEMENAFLKCYDKKGETQGRGESKAYQYMPKITENYLKIVHGIIPVDELKVVTKNYGVTVTSFMTAVYIYAFYKHLGEKIDKPIKIQVPVNLRPIFGFKDNLRNFSLFANVEVNSDMNGCNFEDILKTTVEQMNTGFHKDNLQKIINANVGSEQMAVVRFSPSIVKLPILRIATRLYGERLSTSPFSNIGVINVPDVLKDKIKSFDFVIGATRVNNIYMTMNSFNGKTVVTFSSRSKETEVQKIFFDFLREQGMSVETDF